MFCFHSHEKRERKEEKKRRGRGGRAHVKVSACIPTPVRRHVSRTLTRSLFCICSISPNLLTRLHKNYQQDGLTPPTRRTGGRKNNARCLTLQDTEKVVRYIKNYAEDNAVSLPGRVPDFKREDIRLLPSAVPKSRFYRLCGQHAADNGKYCSLIIVI